MAQQVVAIQNGDSAINVKYQYKDVYSLEIGENAKIRMNFHSLCEILTALHLWTDIVDGKTNPKIYIHDYDLGEVGPEKYDVSARTEFGELVKKI